MPEGLTLRLVLVCANHLSRLQLSEGRAEGVVSECVSPAGPAHSADLQRRHYVMLRRDTPQKQQEVLLTKKTAAKPRIRGAKQISI